MAPPRKDPNDRRTCPKCGRSFIRRSFLNRSYCYPCALAYNREWKRRKRSA